MDISLNVYIPKLETNRNALNSNSHLNPFVKDISLQKYNILYGNQGVSEINFNRMYDNSYNKHVPFYNYLDSSSNFTLKQHGENDDVRIFFRDEMGFLDNFQKFSKVVNKAYMSPASHNSTNVDLIALYLKGQKILYTESKTYCEICLYFIMLPAIFISSGCTVISIALKLYENGALIVSGFTALNSFLLALITYLKLDAKSEAHKTSAYQFDRLETKCEFLSGKVLLLEDTNARERIREFVEEVGNKVQEIKDTNQFIIPEKIRTRYPNLYSMNIFSLVNKYKSEQLAKKKELYTIYERIEREIPNVSIEALLKKEQLTQDIIRLRNISSEIRDKCFQEVELFNETRRKSMMFTLWLRT
jgi:hypothetical protein